MELPSKSLRLNHSECEILLLCIQSLNYPGKDIIRVGLLGDKIQKHILKIEKEAEKLGFVKVNEKEDLK